MSRIITLLSWNVNGIRSAVRKGFDNFLTVEKPTILGLQEIKISDEARVKHGLAFPDWKEYWHPASRPGYSGTAVLSGLEPVSVKMEFGDAILSAEGRLVELDFESFVFLNVYFPNGKSGPERLEYKMAFYRAFLKHLLSLKRAGRAVIFCGDVNTAHTELDLARPKENAKVSGFLPIEREWIDEVVSAGFIDTFRHFFPEKRDCYSWWDQKSRARERNVGWRIDYFFISQDLLPKLEEAMILSEVEGSDHCPVGIKLKL